MKLRDVGEIGEKVFEQWCAQAGITANKAARDRTGWDYFVELPHHRDDAALLRLPLDKRPPPVSGLVQVKSTDRRLKSQRIKLSNLLRAVESPLPAFFLMMEFDGENSCQRAFLVHVGRDVIAIILERLRSLGTGHSTASLNRQRLPISYGDSDRLPTLDGEGLAANLRGLVGNFETYAQRKAAWREEVGYEKGRQLLDLRIALPRGGSSEERSRMLTDFELGIVPELPVRPGGRVWDERFGIRHPVPIATLKTAGRLRKGPVGRGTIRLCSSDGNAPVTLDVEAFSTSRLSEAGGAKVGLVRFASPFVEFIVPHANFGRWSLRFRVPPTDRAIALSDLLPLAHVVRLFESRELLAADLSIEDFRFGGGIRLDGVVDPALSSMAETVLDTWTVSTALGGSPSQPVQLGDLLRQRAELRSMSEVLRGSTTRAKATFEPPPEHADVTGRPVCFPKILDVWLGNVVLAVSVAYLGVAQREKSWEDCPTYSVKFDTATVHRRIVVVPESASVTPLELLHEVAVRFDQSHTVLRWWEWTTSDPSPGHGGAE